MNPPARPVSPPRDKRLRLAGPGLDLYAETAARLVLAGRLNKTYPDPFGAAGYLRALSATLRAGVYDGAVLDRSSGLPTLQEMVTVHADREVAEDFLRGQDARLAAGRAPTAKVAAKTAYYRKLARFELPRLHTLAVRLRRVDAERKVAAFEAVFDRYDAAESVFVRYTLLLEQQDGAYGEAFVHRSGDYSQQTERFRQLMERYTQDESELAFLLLGKLPGVRIEEVTRARVGPLWSPWTGAPAGWFPEASDGGDGGFILHLPLDRASVDLDEDRDNDPFATIYRRFLSESSRPLVEDEARRLGYRVHKERKFVCTPSVLPLLRERLREAGTRNMVYTP